MDFLKFALIMALVRAVLPPKKKFLPERRKMPKLLQNVPHLSLIILIYQIFKIRPTSNFIDIFVIFWSNFSTQPKYKHH